MTDHPITTTLIDERKRAALSGERDHRSAMRLRAPCKIIMEFTYGKNDWKTIRRGQENCFLLTNRKGGYSTLSLIDSLARNEHNLLMASVKAPNSWVQLISKLETIVETRGRVIGLSAQEYKDPSKNQMGQRFLDHFEMDLLPRWRYLAGGIAIDRTLIMGYEDQTVAVRYELENRTDAAAKVLLRPWLRFTPKGVMPGPDQHYAVTEDRIESSGITLYWKSDGRLRLEDPQFIDDLHFEDDARDDRASVGAVHTNHHLEYSLVPGETRSAYVIYSLSPIHETPDAIRDRAVERAEDLIRQAGVDGALGEQLALACDRFVVDRESTAGRTIIAGYPFFGDWGRDTMIAVMGCCIAAGRKEDAESIFRTFMKYIDKGIMPNMFPEGDEQPRYNTADASLLFIYAVYEYYRAFGDLDFVREAMPVMEDIIDWYRNGTDFSIAMEEDGLIRAGAGFDQVTWMDVRIGDVLPTPRHGKPVEINAYWYNDLKIMACFSNLLGGAKARAYEELSTKVRDSFRRQFWNERMGCLRDVVSGNPYDDQIRCNQIWAVSVPFGMLEAKEERQVLDTVFEHLYTPYGLRSLSPQDPEFKPVYGGSLWNRDNAYHQGTVWGFPLGGYYLAYLKVHGYCDSARQRVIEDISQLEGTLREGCIGQIAEIFDGETPAVSRGCFAQAWSVGELFRALKAAQSEAADAVPERSRPV